MIILTIEPQKEIELIVEDSVIVLELEPLNNIPSNAYEVYKGEHVVTPSRYDGTVLQTADKLMTDNVTVKTIPYFVTGNLSGGNTCYIGNEVIENG